MKTTCIRLFLISLTFTFTLLGCDSGKVQSKDCDSSVRADACLGQVEAYSHLYSINEEFDDVVDDFKMAVEMRGIKISSIAYISRMLKRTAEAVGVKETVYRQGLAVAFCKSDLSHKMLAEAPHSIVLCPYRVIIYELETTPGTVFLSYRPFPELENETANRAVKQIELLLDSLIRETGASRYSGRKK